MRFTVPALRTVEARRLLPNEGRPRLRVDNDVAVRLVQAVVPDSARIEFEAITTYGPAGILRLVGSVFLAGDEAKSAVESWTKQNALPPELLVAFQNHVLAHSVAISMQLARFVGLPSPVPLPEIRLDRPAERAEAPAPPPATSASPEVG